MCGATNCQLLVKSQAVQHVFHAAGVQNAASLCIVIGNVEESALAMQNPSEQRWFELEFASSLSCHVVYTRVAVLCVMRCST